LIPLFHPPYHRYFSLPEIGNRHKITPHPCVNGCGVIVFE
jgi:hypothetical protein